MTNFEKNPDEIGALWKKQSKKGTDYLTGSIELDGVKTNVVVFYNSKAKENHPSFRIYKAKPYEKPASDTQPNLEQIPF